MKGKKIWKCEKCIWRSLHSSFIHFYGDKIEFDNIWEEKQEEKKTKNKTQINAPIKIYYTIFLY